MDNGWMQDTEADDIHSLCCIRNRGERTVEICRFADLDTYTGTFSPYSFPRGTDFYAAERDLLYGSLSLVGEPDSIALFTWHPYQDNNNAWKTEVRNCDLDWIEVITSTYENPDKIVEQIRNGWRPPYPLSTWHSLLITCRTMSSQAVSVLIPRDAFVSREGKLYFADGVIHLKTGAINVSRDTALCTYRYAQSTNRRYMINADCFVQTSTVAVQSTDTVVDSVIQAQIQKIDQSLMTRKEKQAARYALTKLSLPTVSQMIAERLQCSTEHAQELVEQYLSSRQHLLDEDAVLCLVDTLIANNSSYVQTLRMKVEEDWRKQQAELLAAAQSRVDTLQVQYEEIQSKVQAAKDAVEKAERQRLICEEQAQDALQLQADIDAQIKQKLAAIVQNRAAALVETAFLQAALPSSEAAVPATISPAVTQSYSIDAPDQPETLADSALSESMADAEEAWKELCASKNLENIASELTALCFAAYACHQPLLFAGEAAESAADLYASSIIGSVCTKVWLARDTDESALLLDIEKVPHDFICIVNGLERGYDTTRRLMQHFSDSTFVVTIPHAEALAMEPDSLFSTFIPVLLDCFCADTHFQPLQPFSCASNLQTYEQPKPKELAKVISTQQKWFDGGFTSPLLRRRCASMAAFIERFYRDNFLSAGSAEEASLVLLFFSLMKCLNRKESVSRIFDRTTTMNDDLRELLLAYAGIKKESEE